MQLTTSAFDDGDPIPGRYAFAVPDPTSHLTFSDNRSPGLAWEQVPEGTRSFALICVDLDAPSSAEDVNREDRMVPADLERAEFFHWVAVDLSGEIRSLAEGASSDGVVPRGKVGRTDDFREGLNDYTSWFAGDEDMEGVYKGYDGPCPPWNDSVVHHYVFTLFALDTDSVPVQGDFTAPEVREAISGRVLAKASVTGTYTLTGGMPGD